MSHLYCLTFWSVFNRWFGLYALRLGIFSHKCLFAMTRLAAKLTVYNWGRKTYKLWMFDRKKQKISPRMVILVLFLVFSAKASAFAFSNQDVQKNTLIDQYKGLPELESNLAGNKYIKSMRWYPGQWRLRNPSWWSVCMCSGGRFANRINPAKKCTKVQALWCWHHEYWFYRL